MRHNLQRYRETADLDLFYLMGLSNDAVPYLVTDLIHLRAIPPVPLWYDLILLLLFAYLIFSLAPHHQQQELL